METTTARYRVKAEVARILWSCENTTRCTKDPRASSSLEQGGVRSRRGDLLQDKYPVKNHPVACACVAATLTVFDIRTPFKGGHQCLAFDLSRPLSHFSSRER